MAKKRQKRGQYHRNKDWKPKFLDEFRKTGNIRVVCQLLLLDRKTVWSERQNDPEFADAFLEAQKDAADTLEAEARRRAVDGVMQKKFTKSGEPIIDPKTGEQYFELQYSDMLLLAMLRAHNPEKYRDNHDVQISGGVDHRHEVHSVMRTVLSDPEAHAAASQLAKRMAAIEASATARRELPPAPR